MRVLRSVTHLLALLHDLDLLVAHVQHLLQDGGAAVQRSVFCLEVANLLGQLLDLLVKVLDLGLHSSIAIQKQQYSSNRRHGSTVEHMLEVDYVKASGSTANKQCSTAPVQHQDSVYRNSSSTKQYSATWAVTRHSSTHSSAKQRYNSNVPDTGGMCECANRAEPS